MSDRRTRKTKAQLRAALTKLLEQKKINEIISSLDKTVCRYDGRYKYEVFTGGTEYDISLHKVRDGKNEKLAECSMSTKGELYCNNRKYTIDENESFKT